MEQINIRISDNGSFGSDLDQWKVYKIPHVVKNLQNIPYLQNISKKIFQVNEVNEERVFCWSIHLIFTVADLASLLTSDHPQHSWTRCSLF